MDPALTAELLAGGVTVTIAVVGWGGRLLARIDTRTKRVDDEIDHLHRTVYGDPQDDNDDGLVGEVATNTERVTSSEGCDE